MNAGVFRLVYNQFRGLWMVVSECPVEGCKFIGKNANGLRLHAKKHQGVKTPNVLSKSTENPATQESVS